MDDRGVEDEIENIQQQPAGHQMMENGAEEEEEDAAQADNEIAEVVDDDSSYDDDDPHSSHFLVHEVFDDFRFASRSGSSEAATLDFTSQHFENIQGRLEATFLRECRKYRKKVKHISIPCDFPVEEEEEEGEDFLEEHWRFYRFLGRCIGVFTSLKSISIEGSDMLGAAILLENVPQITSFNFMSNSNQGADPPVGAHSLELALAGLSNLEVLEVVDITRAPIFFRIFFKAIPRMRRLTTLKLWGYERDDPDGLHSIFRRLPNSLKEIEFTSCTFGSLDNIALADMLAYNSHLKILKQQQCSTDVDSSMLVSQGLVTNTALIELKIDVCPADSKFYGALVLSLRMNCSLKKLELGIEIYPGQEEGGEEEDDDDDDGTARTRNEIADAIHSAGLRDIFLVSLKSNRSIESIRLCCFFYDDFLLGAIHSYLTTETALLRSLDLVSFGSACFDSKIFSQLFHTVGQNKSLKFFRVSGDIKVLGKEVSEAVLSLQENKSLEELSIRPSAQLYDTGSEIFVDCMKNLKKNCGVKTFEVMYNCYDSLSFTEEQLDTILDVLKHNYRLSNCRLITCAIKSKKKGVEQLIKTYLKLNGNGRSYLQEANPSKERGIALIEAVSDDLDAIYVSILENPLLCARSSMGEGGPPAGQNGGDAIIISQPANKKRRI